MDNGANGLHIYRELADLYEQRGQVPARDRYLILAADAALAAGLPDEAERLRQRLLRTSRHHMLKPYASFAEAAEGPDVKTYLRDMRLNYPVEAAAEALRMLQTSGPAEQAHPTPPPPSSSAPPTPFPPAKPIRNPDIPPTAPLGSIPSERGPARLDQPPAPLNRRETDPVRHEPAPVPPTKSPPVRRSAPLPKAAPVPAPQPEAPEAPAGGWLGLTLSGLVITAALAWAAFTLGRPFLPPGWLP